MDQEPFVIRGLLNDLTRALLSSAIFLDDLHLNLQQYSEVYDSWWLANEQLKRAIELFLDLKSTYFCHFGTLDPSDQGQGESPFPESTGQTLLKHAAPRTSAQGPLKRRKSPR